MLGKLTQAGVSVMHQGKSVTFASALPALLQVRRQGGSLRGALGCRGQPAYHAVPESTREVTLLDWSHCPLDLLAGPHLRACEQLDRFARISPLQGFPDRYAPWVLHGLTLLRQERGE
jgi:hypothetical protein